MRDIPQPDKLSARRAKKAALIPRRKSPGLSLVVSGDLSNGVKININNLQDKLFVSPKVVTKVIRAVLLKEKYRKPIKIDACFVTDKVIKGFNLTYLGHNYPTDVIAFGVYQDKSGCPCADIIISAQRAIVNSKVFKTAPLYELYLYLAHGVLHVLGYDDNTLVKRKIMQEKAEKILLLCNVNY